MTPIEKIITALYGTILHREISDTELSERLLHIPANMEVLDYALHLTDELLLSEEYQGKSGLNSSSFVVKDVDIFYAYKFLLGRLPESEIIYSDKRNSPNIEHLLETIINSEEFKSNRILKDTIALRRKPHDFQSASTSPQDHSKKIIVLSGCQAKTIADLFQIKSGLTTVPHLFMGGAALNHFVTTQGQAYLENLKSFDLIYTQKKGLFDTLRNIDTFSDRVRLMPIVEYAAFQPDQIYVTSNITHERIVGPLGEYQSLIAAAAFYSGFNQAKCRSLFDPSVYNLIGFEETAAAARVDLLHQQNTTGYPLASLMSLWDEKGKWMRSVNHPKKFVLSDLVTYALEQESIPVARDIDEYVSDELASNVDWPVYPGLSANIPSDIGFRFKLPNALVPTANAGVFLTLEEFIDATYRSLAPYNLSDVHVKQLDRHIDFDSILSKLANI